MQGGIYSSLAYFQHEPRGYQPPAVLPKPKYNKLKINEVLLLGCYFKLSGIIGIAPC